MLSKFSNVPCEGKILIFVIRIILIVSLNGCWKHSFVEISYVRRHNHYLCESHLNDTELVYLVNVEGRLLNFCASIKHLNCEDKRLWGQYCHTDEFFQLKWNCIVFRYSIVCLDGELLFTSIIGDKAIMIVIVRQLYLVSFIVNYITYVKLLGLQRLIEGHKLKLGYVLYKLR